MVGICGEVNRDDVATSLDLIYSVGKFKGFCCVYHPRHCSHAEVRCVGLKDSDTAAGYCKHEAVHFVVCTISC